VAHSEETFAASGKSGVIRGYPLETATQMTQSKVRAMSLKRLALLLCLPAVGEELAR